MHLSIEPRSEGVSLHAPRDGVSFKDVRYTSILKSVCAADIGQLDEILALLDGDDIDTCDVRFGKAIQQLGTGEQTLRRAIADLKKRAALPRGPEPSVHPQISELHARLARVKAFNLREELLDVLESLTSSRKAIIIAARFGWRDGRQRTLKQVGDSIGLTRERVRQIEACIRQKLPKRRVYAPALMAALQLARRLAPCSAELYAKALTDAGLTETAWLPAVVLRAAEFLRVPNGLLLYVSDGVALLATRAFRPEILRHVRACSLKHARSHGAAHLARIALELSAKLERLVAPAEVRAIVNSMPDKRWIDESKGWYWFGDERNTILLKRIKRLLSVVHQMPMDDLYEGLIRSRRTDDEIVAPKWVLSKVFAEISWLRIRQGSQVGVVEAVAAQELLSSTDRIMVKILAESGGILDHYNFRRKCQEHGIALSTFNIYKASRGLFVRLGPDIWSLRGAKVDPQTLLKLMEQGIRRELSRLQCPPS